MDFEIKLLPAWHRKKEKGQLSPIRFLRYMICSMKEWRALYQESKVNLVVKETTNKQTRQGSRGR